MRSRVPTTARVNLRLETGTLKHEALFWFDGCCGTLECGGLPEVGEFSCFFSRVAVHGKRDKQSYAGFGVVGCEMVGSVLLEYCTSTSASTVDVLQYNSSSNLEYSSTVLHSHSRILPSCGPKKGSANASLPMSCEHNATQFSLSLWHLLEYGNLHPPLHRSKNPAKWCWKPNPTR